MPRGCLEFVIVVFPDHTHLLLLVFFKSCRFTQVLMYMQIATKLYSAKLHRLARVLTTLIEQEMLLYYLFKK